MRAILKKWLQQERRVLITATAVAGTVMIVRWFGLLQLWEWAAFDQFVRWRPAEPIDNRILTLPGLKAQGFLDQPVDLLIDAAIKE